MPGLYRLIGLFFLLLLAVWNVWIIEELFSPDGELSNYTKGWIWISDFVLLATGMLVIKYQRKAVLNIFLVLVSVIMGLGIFEVILRTGVLDQESNPHPVWIPAKFEEPKKQLESAHDEFIRQNPPFQFFDIPRKRTKAEGYSRIAVTSDSFIEGWATPYDQVWSHKLEKRVKEQFKNIEVLSWGKSGWETVDQFRFLKEHGIGYGIDLLIVGFVINDPSLGNIPARYLVWQHTKPMVPIRMLFPNVLDYFAAHINLWLGRYVFRNYGYEKWISKIYSENNLLEYGKLLKEFSEFCTSKHIPLLFVLTPNDYDPSNRELFDKVIPLLKNANIEYLDLYTPVYERLHTYPQRELWITRADSHPGPLVTEVYADEVFRFLKNRGILQKLAETPKSGDRVSAKKTGGYNMTQLNRQSRLFVCYIRDTRRIGCRTTPFLAVGLNPWTRFISLPSNELLPTLVTGVGPSNMASGGQAQAISAGI